MLAIPMSVFRRGRTLSAGISQSDACRCRLKFSETKWVRVTSAMSVIFLDGVPGCSPLDQNAAAAGRKIRQVLVSILIVGSPFAIAGLWREWAEPDGKVLSMTMITVNANEHPLMRRFHKPGDEKRSVVIVPAGEFENWLDCRSTDEARSFLIFPADAMRAETDPAPPRKKAVAST